MRKNANHKVRFTDAVAPSLECVWYYSAIRHEWEYLLYADRDGFHCLSVLGQEYTSHEALEIEALSPVKVGGATPANYIDRLAYTRACAGWSY